MFCYWRDDWENTCLNDFEIKQHERAYVRWLAEPIGERWFQFIVASFPFYNMPWDPEVSLAGVFLHLIFAHNRKVYSVFSTVFLLLLLLVVAVGCPAAGFG